MYVYGYVCVSVWMCVYAQGGHQLLFPVYFRPVGILLLGAHDCG